MVGQAPRGVWRRCGWISHEGVVRNVIQHTELRWVESTGSGSEVTESVVTDSLFCRTWWESAIESQKGLWVYGFRFWRNWTSGHRFIVLQKFVEKVPILKKRNNGHRFVILQDVIESAVQTRRNWICGSQIPYSAKHDWIYGFRFWRNWISGHRFVSDYSAELNWVRFLGAEETESVNTCYFVGLGVRLYLSVLPSFLPSFYRSSPLPAGIICVALSTTGSIVYF